MAKTTYHIITMVGDYPVENQPNHSAEFFTLKDAIKTATEQHRAMESLYIADQTYHTIVCIDDKDDAIAVWLICGDGIYEDAEAERLSRILEEHED